MKQPALNGQWVMVLDPMRHLVDLLEYLKYLKSTVHLAIVHSVLN
jgi:hypothetical protein